MAARPTPAYVHEVKASAFNERTFFYTRCDVIGMTNMPEARLAGEAELCFGTVAMLTDFDCARGTAGM